MERAILRCGTVEISSDERFCDSLDYIRERMVRGVAALDAVAEVVISNCKAFYINERVKLPIHDLVLRNAFTSALLAFDRDTDKIIAKTLLGDLVRGGSCCLDSVYDFMLTSLKERWNEVIQLANDNMCYLVCRKTFEELLSFLISNIDCKIDDTMFMHIPEKNTREEVKKLFT